MAESWRSVHVTLGKGMDFQLKGDSKQLQQIYKDLQSYRTDSATVVIA